MQDIPQKKSWRWSGEAELPVASNTSALPSLPGIKLTPRRLQNPALLPKEEEASSSATD